MASTFSRSEPVIVVPPHRRFRAAARKTQFLLYPAFAYRVIAPQRQTRELNIIERAVLGLCRANVSKARDIGALLHIHEQLAAKVIRRLQSRHFLSADAVPSPEGIRALHRVDPEQDALPIAGYVFQDVWSRRLWPQFVERLVYAETSPRQNEFVDLLLGSAGTPRRENAFTVFPRESFTTIAPSAADVLQVLRRQTQGPSDMPEDDDSDGYGVGATVLTGARRLERLTHIEPEPRRVYLTMIAYAPTVPIDGAFWEVTDPFEGSRSPIARDAVTGRVRSDPRLAEIIGRLVEEVVTENGASMADLLARLASEAELFVQSRLSSYWHDTPTFRRCLAMQRSLREAEVAADTCPEDKLDDVLLKTQKAMEEALRDVQRRHPLGDLWQLLSPTDRAGNATLLDKAAAQVGFSSGMPAGCASVEQRLVRRTAQQNTGSLRPRLVALVLAAQYKLLHPLRLAAPDFPSLLVELDELATLRNEGAHASEHTLLSLPKVSALVDLAFRAVTALGE